MNPLSNAAEFADFHMLYDSEYGRGNIIQWRIRAGKKAIIEQLQKVQNSVSKYLDMHLSIINIFIQVFSIDGNI